MKKFLSVTIVVAMLVSVFSVIATLNTYAASGWTAGSIFNSEMKSEGYYSVVPQTGKTGTTYFPVSFELKDQIAAIMGSKDSAEFTVKFDYRITLKEGATKTGNDHMIVLKGTLADGAEYNGTYFVQQGGSIYWPQNRDDATAYPKPVHNGEWQTYENTITLNQADITNMTSLSLVWWNLKEIENVESIDLKSVTVTSTAAQDDSGINWSAAEYADTSVQEELGAKYLKVTPKSETTGTQYFPISYEFKDKIIALMGSKDSVKFTVKFDYRITLKEGATKTGNDHMIVLKGMLADGAEYNGTYFVQQDGTTYWPQNRNDATAYPKPVHNGEWQTYENTITLNQVDITNMTSLSLVWWNIKEIEKVESIDLTELALTEVESNQDNDTAKTENEIAWNASAGIMDGVEEEENGVKYLKASPKTDKTGTQYFPVSLELKETLTKLLGDSNSITFNVKFKYRVNLKAGSTKTGMDHAIMLKGTLLNGDEYKGTYFTQQGGSIYWPQNRDDASAYPKPVHDGKWQTYENTITLEKSDIENMTSLALVWWNIKEIENVTSIDIESAVVTTNTRAPEEETGDAALAVAAVATAAAVTALACIVVRKRRYTI